MSVLLFILSCACVLPIIADNGQLLEFAEPTKCKKQDFFDPITLSCRKCNFTENLEPSENRLKCVCNKFSKMIGFDNGRPICLFCGPNATVTSDGKNCITCNNAVCKCAGNERKVERNANGETLDTIQCLPCPNDFYVSHDGTECLPCNYSNDRLENCICPKTTHIRIENQCFPKNDLTDLPLLTDTYLVHFNKISIDSLYLRNNLQRAVYLCKKKDIAACEHLAHMCLLTLFENEIICSLYAHNNISPQDSFYTKDHTEEMLNSNYISKRYSLDGNNRNNTLNFTFATFSLQGDFLSLDKPNLPCNFLSNVRFGINLKKKCSVSTLDLLKSDIKFFVPYLTFDKGDSILLHLSPILIASTNKNSDIPQGQMMKKFFIVDNINGIETLPNVMDGTYKKSLNLSFLRYMKSLNILVTVQNEYDHGKIYPPLFIVEYGELSKEQMKITDEVVIDYSIRFVLKNNQLNTFVEVFVGVLSGLAVIYSAIKSWSYCRRDNFLDIKMLLWFFIYTLGAIGNILILVIIIQCIYLFVMFKCQTVPQVLLPDEDSEHSIWICCTAAFCFKLVEMCGLIYNLWSMDIFFIDWEQPKTIMQKFKYDSPHTSLKKSYAKRFDKKEYKLSVAPSEIIAAKRKHLPKKQSLKDKKLPPIRSITDPSIDDSDANKNNQNSSVTIWRTYFMANEWLKLQTVRRVNIILHSIYVLFLLEVIGLKHWALSTPELFLNNKNPNIIKNFSLEFGLCSLIYAFTYLVQYLTSVLFYERYIKNKIQEFIDLCPIMNISVFIFSPRNDGFYIHGRSVHGFADIDLYTLVSNLETEERELCAQRGLLPGTVEQTFILSLTSSFRKLYDDISKKENKINRFSKNKFFMEDTVDRRLKVNQFLCQYLDHCFKKEDYIIKEQNLIEKLCNIMFTDVTEKSVFYNDNGHSFDRTMIYGNEWLFFFFEIAFFLFTLMQSRSYICALIIYLLLSQLLACIIRFNTSRNISKKSILDDRFLM
ncbi:meckelin [Prorops nasuta]|uniref:meckelin n=1 Tax=Prorops nasuta TaxID=863751 RepID=UPI0034CF687F